MSVGIGGRGQLALALSFFFVLAITAPVSAADCSKLTETNMKPNEAVATAVDCVGWLDHPGDIPANDQRALLAPTLNPSGGRGELGTGLSLGSLPAGALANEFLSLIAEIAVDRARRQGLAFIKERIQGGVCGLEFSSAPMGKVLPATCTLVTSTDLQVLVGDGRSLRAALGSDIVDIAGRRVTMTGSPVERSAGAALALVKRFVADPDAQLTKNDVWLVVDAFLNEPWNAPEDTSKPTGIETLQYGIAAARVYVQAVQMTTPGDRSRVDLAFVMRELKRVHKNAAPTSPDMLEYANLASKAVLASKSDGAEDYVARLRAAVALIFQSMAKIQRGGKPLIPVWIHPAVTAALDANAPHLVAAIADAAGALLIKDCPTGDVCRPIRKFSTLLTGIATYALTYDNTIPEKATPEQRLAFLKDQRDARKEALESVIDAASDRNGREGTAVWSLGVGVGGTLFTRQRVDTTAATGSATGLTEQIGFQLHVPLGIAYQWLPSKNWLRPVPVHLMVSFLDLGNYVGKTPEPDTSPDWRAIFAPGVQAAVAVPGLSRPSNLVLVGYSLTFAPQFVEGESTSTSTGFRASRRHGLFVNYYVPLWDFN